jgi:hypothetical protein
VADDVVADGCWSRRGGGGGAECQQEREGYRWVPAVVGAGGGADAGGTGGGHGHRRGCRRERRRHRRGRLAATTRDEAAVAV